MCVCIWVMCCKRFSHLLVQIYKLIRPASDSWCKPVVLKCSIGALVCIIFSHSNKNPPFHCFSPYMLKFWDNATVLPKGHRSGAFGRAGGQLRCPTFGKSSHAVAKSICAFCPDSVPDFCNVICKSLRVLKDKINLRTGFSLYDLEGNDRMLLVDVYLPWKSFFMRELVGFWQGLYKLNGGRRRDLEQSSPF